MSQKHLFMSVFSALVVVVRHSRPRLQYYILTLQRMFKITGYRVDKRAK